MKKKILLIDDEPVFNFLHTEIILSADIDCEIETALNGRQGLDIISKNIKQDNRIHDVIFVDINMPVMDGFEFISSFETIEGSNKEKTILAVVTSSLNRRDEEQARSLGIKHYFSKPLTEVDVLQIMGMEN